MRERSLKIPCLVMVIVLGLFWLPHLVKAKQRDGVVRSKPTVDSFYNVKVGNIGVYVDNFGLIGNSRIISATFEWPAGSGALYLFEGRLWFGSIVEGAKLVSTGDDFEWATTDDPADTVQVTTGEKATSELDTYCSFQDNAKRNSDREIGIKVIQRTYAWSISYLADFLIYDWTLTNVTGKDLTDCYVGLAMDADICSKEGTEPHIDDLTSYDSVNKISYLYDWDNPKIPGNDIGGPNGECPGYIGTIPLSSPPAADGKTLKDTPTSHYWWDWNHDPGTDDLKYDYMASHKHLDTPSSPFDYRYLQAYGPYNLKPKESIRIITATGMGKGITGLQTNLLAAKKLFDANANTEGKWLVSEPPPSPTLVVKPGDKSVTLTWDSSPESHIDPITKEADYEGYRIWKSATGVIGDWTLLADFDKIDAYSLNAGLPQKNAEGLYEFTDTNVHNGYPYYYAVTSYDYGDLSEIGSLESSQVTNRTYTSPSALAQDKDAKKIYVYPNPYRAAAPWDFKPNKDNPSEERVRFNNIPGECTIRIYTLAGDLVKEIKHTDGTGSQDWDLISRNTQKIVSGIYLYQIEAKGINHIDKLVVIR